MARSNIRPSGTAGRHTFGGLSDAAFRMVPLLEAGRNADWPWAARGGAPGPGSSPSPAR